MFDYDGNGHMDCGEQFIGYQIFRDVTEPFAGGGCGGRSGGSSPEEAPSGQKPARRRLRMDMDGWTIFGIIALVYVILDAICR